MLHFPDIQLFTQFTNENNIDDYKQDIKGTLWLFMLKPDGLNYSSGWVSLHDFLSSILQYSKLQYEAYLLIDLTINDIYSLYPHLLKKSPFWEERKLELIQHLQSGVNLIWFVKWDNVIDKLQHIKVMIRSIILWNISWKQKAVQNLMHVPSLEEYDSNEEVFLNNYKKTISWKY